jgi:hypothetical protein
MLTPSVIADDPDPTGANPMPRIANRILAATEPATEERHDALVAAARDRADRTLGGLVRLLEERPELQGVHPPADLAAESIRWTA